MVNVTISEVIVGKSGEIMEIRLELTHEDVEELNKLMQEAKIGTHAELFSNALTILYWATKEVKAGQIVASLNEKSGGYKEFAMPVLEALKNKRSIEESFGVISGTTYKTQ